jgi:hypothetical protein
MSGLEMLAYVLGMWFVVRPLGRWLARRADARAGIGPVEEERLAQAFEIIGPEHVARGLTATGHGWNDCFLALATGGEPYGLRPALRKGWRTTPRAGLPIDLTKALVRAWDRKESAFRAFAGEWLESREQVRASSPALHAAGPRVRMTQAAISQRGA